jgi:alanine racemase
MDCNIKIPFIIKNIQSISSIIRKTNNHTKIGIVFKESYKIFEKTNIPYLVHQINSNSPSLIDVYFFGILSDAVIARKLGITNKIINLYYILPSEANLAIEHDIEIACPGIEWLKKTLDIIKGKTIKLHVYFDSGFGRLGLTSKDELYELLKEMKKHSNIIIAGLGTHFNSLTNGENNHIDQWRMIYNIPIEECNTHYKKIIKDQINNFDSIITYVKENKLITEKTLIHAATSRGVINEITETYYDLIRVGGLAFKTILNHFKEKQQIITIKNIPINSCIGYFCPPNKKTKKNIKVAYLESKILNCDYKYKGIILSPIGTIQPFGLDVSDIEDIKVGDFIDVESITIL